MGGGFPLRWQLQGVGWCHHSRWHRGRGADEKRSSAGQAKLVPWKSEVLNWLTWDLQNSEIALRTRNLTSHLQKLLSQPQRSSASGTQAPTETPLRCHAVVLLPWLLLLVCYSKNNLSLNDCKHLVLETRLNLGVYFVYQSPTWGFIWILNGCWVERDSERRSVRQLGRAGTGSRAVPDSPCFFTSILFSVGVWSWPVPLPALPNFEVPLVKHWWKRWALWLSSIR